MTAVAVFGSTAVRPSVAWLVALIILAAYWNAIVARVRAWRHRRLLFGFLTALFMALPFMGQNTFVDFGGSCSGWWSWITCTV